MNETKKIAAIFYINDFVSNLKNACRMTGNVTSDTLLSCELGVIHDVTKTDVGEVTLYAVACINEFAHRIKNGIPDDGKLPFEIVDLAYFMFLNDITSKDTAVCAKEGAKE